MPDARDQRQRPDFIVPGFSRCGTTWLYEVLKQHPRIFLPLRKEINFFDRAFDKGISWYEGYFRDCREDQLAGDISPVYAECAAVPDRILATRPAARIIILVRDPLARLRSIYHHLQRDGRRNDELCAYLTGAAPSSDYLSRQLYAPALEAYAARFGPERLLVCLHEELERHPRAVIERMLSFLGLGEEGLPPALEAALPRRINPTFAPRQAGLYRTAQSLHQRLRRTQIRWLDAPLDLGKRTFFTLFGERQRTELGPIPGEERLHAFFADDRRAVERFLGRSLDGLWR